MGNWWIAPYWVAERRSQHDDAGRLFQVDYQLTELHITNPTDSDGVVDLVFYEARGDGNYYRSDWAGGSWTAPPLWQRHYRPDPSLVFGDTFITWGWFEAWTSLKDITIDVVVRRIARNMISGGPTPGAGGVVENISQRTIGLVRRSVPVSGLLGEVVDRMLSRERSRLFSPGQPPSSDLTTFERFEPDDEM